MSYNDKKNNGMEMDDLNIKSHLNTSLDLSGISVSEDLINRTLAAIKEQSVSSKEEETKDGTDKQEKRVLPWNKYVRGIAGIAAAAIVAVIGINYINQAPMENKKAELAIDSAMPESATSSTESNMSSQTVPGGEKMGEDASVLTDGGQEAQKQFTITAEAYAGGEDSGSGVSGDAALNGEAALANENVEAPEQADIAVSEEESQGITSDENVTQKFSSLARNMEEPLYSFRDIFIPSPEQAQYITISDDRNNTSVTLTKQEDIEAFYLVMDSHQFSAAGTDSEADLNFTVEMNSSELGMLYTMEVGSNLTVRYTQGENVVEMQYYAVDDSRFKSELAEFYTGYSE
jgi:hypothetical protein